MPDTPLKGSIELITNPGQPTATSDGIVVQHVTVEAVPMLVQMVYGIADLTPTETEGVQVAAWTGTNDRLQPITVVLWPEPAPYVPQEDTP